MFCENCGNKIKEGDIFCDKCGNKVFSDGPLAKGEYKDLKNPLEDKAWFRFAKVLYMGVYTLSILFGLVLLNDSYTSDEGLWSIIVAVIFFTLLKKSFYYIVLGKTDWK